MLIVKKDFFEVADKTKIIGGGFTRKYYYRFSISEYHI